jgi:3-phenylpropionate/cinnamic acid dioxygenase small subunit
MDSNIATPLELRLQVQDFYVAYASLLDERAATEWPGLYTEDAVYTLTTHANANNKGLYLVYEKGRAALTRRAAVVSTGYLKAQRNKTLHMISNVRVLEAEGALIRTSAYFAMFRTARDRTSQLQACGSFRDVLDSSSALRFAEHNVIVDAETLPANMVDLF